MMASEDDRQMAVNHLNELSELQNDEYASLVASAIPQLLVSKNPHRHTPFHDFGHRARDK